MEVQRAHHLQNDTYKFTLLVFPVHHHSKNFKEIHRGKKQKKNIWKVIKRNESVTQTEKKRLR